MIIIKGESFELSPRKAKDVLNLVEAVKNMEENEITSISAMCQMINDSLKASAAKISWYQIIKKYKYNKFVKGAVEYILANLSVIEVYAYYNEILELEGGKKKVVEQEKQSDEKLSEGSYPSTME
jgi:hypothetical protein